MASPDLNVDSKLTDEVLERARGRIGEVNEISGAWNTEATRDAIRHFAEGIGDDNPLWTDIAYGEQTRWGSILGPPSFLMSCNQGPAWRGRTTGGFRGFPGVHRFWATESWEYLEPIRRGDAIVADTRLVDLIPHESELAGRSIEDVQLQNFYNQNGDQLASHRFTFINSERSTSRKRGKHRSFEEYRWTDESLAALHADIELEERRGAEPRYWEDVEIGADIPHVVKGPLSQCEIAAFTAGWGGPFLLASEIAQRYIQAHPKANVPDRETGAPDFPMRAHWDRAFAREVGAPSAYDYGGQRVAWLLSGLTNWCGDDGFVRWIDARFHRFMLLGDALWCRAKVTEKHWVDGQARVDLECSGENQRGQVTVTATASVQLPTRG